MQGFAASGSSRRELGALRTVPAFVAHSRCRGLCPLPDKPLPMDQTACFRPSPFAAPFAGRLRFDAGQHGRRVDSCIDAITVASVHASCQCPDGAGGEDTLCLIAPLCSVR